MNFRIIGVLSRKYAITFRIGKWFLSIPILCAGFHTPPAYAQDSGNRVQSVAIEEVVVTAQKREENLQDIPIAITTLDESTFENFGLENIMDIHGVVPNTIFEKTPGANSSYKLFIRGIGTSNTVFSLDPAVGIYVDGVPLTRSIGALVDLVDVERIEVLRGPQGTLYGRNSSSGAIRLISKKTDVDTRVFKAAVAVGDYNQREVKLVGSIPIIEDQLAVKIALQSKNRDGFQRNTFLNIDADDANSDHIWGSLRYIFNDNAEFNLRADWTKDDSLPHMPASFVNDPDNNLLTFESQVDPRPNYLETWGLSGTLDIALGGVSVTSITGFRKIDYEEATDVDGTILPSFEAFAGMDHEQFSQEIYASADINDSTNWVVGAFYLREDVAYRERFDFLAQAFGYASTQFFQQDVDSVAIYGQISHNLTKKLQITGGLRYTDESKDFAVESFLPLPGMPDPDFNAPNFDFADTRKENVLNWRIAADYKVTDDVLLYATATTGFRSGGFNGNADSLAATAGFDREEVLSIEAGLKMDFLQDRLRLNVGGFMYDFEDIQQALLDIDRFNTVTSDASIAGVELESSLVPIEGLRIDWTASVLANDVDNTDAELQHMPDFQSRVGVSYVRPGSLLGTAGEISVSAAARYSDTYYTSVRNTPSRLSGEYTIVDANLAFETNDKHWRFALVGLNLSDEQYKTQVFDVGNFANTAYVNEPRRWFFRVEYEY